MSIVAQALPQSDRVLNPEKDWALVQLGTEFLRRNPHISVTHSTGGRGFR